MMKINKISSNDCGGFKPPKGHMDTQMYPECEGYETDRNIVKKTEEKNKKKKKKKKKEESQVNNYSIIKKAKHGDSVSQLKQDWLDKAIDSKNFVDEIISHIKWGWIDVSRDPSVRAGIRKAILQLQQDGNYESAANSIAVSLSFGQHVEEGMLEMAGNQKDVVEAKKKKKKKEWDPNPWAICEVSVGKDENPEKFERCVKKVKKNQAFNLKKFKKLAEMELEELREAWEESEEDIKVNEDGEAYYAGKLIAQPNESYGADFVAIREWMNKNGYFPNVWVVNDHGNVSLFSIDESGKETYRGGLV